MSDMDDAAIGEIIDKVMDYIIGLDESPKMIVHEPYMSINNRISMAFEKELQAFYGRV